MFNHYDDAWYPYINLPARTLCCFSYGNKVRMTEWTTFKFVSYYIRLDKPFGDNMNSDAWVFTSINR